MTSVFIISNHSMFGQGLENLLRRETVVNIVGQETDVQEGIQQIKEKQPDVVIIDTNGPPELSSTTVMRLLVEVPQTKVIGLSLHNNNLYIYRALQCIATSPQDLVKAVEQDVLFLSQLDYGNDSSASVWIDD